MSDLTSTEPKEQRQTWSRRRFVTTFSKSAAAVGMFSEPALALALAQSRRRSSHKSPRRKGIALIATEVRKYSHAQHFIDRFLEGYGWEGVHHRPPMDLVALYVDQFPRGDLSRERASRHGVTIYPTISEALTLGSSNLAVDGVLIIGEHGRYPRNAKGQVLYPRYKFFKEIVRVFESSGRSVPVFNDKHLSTDWSEAKEMVDDSKRLGFAFLAGSSLPVTWRIPSIEMPLNAPLEESVCVCYGGVDSYDFHGLETAQCMSERRAGGERGVGSIRAVRGETVWELVKEREKLQKILYAALARSHTLQAPNGFTYSIPTLDYLRQASPETVAYFIEHLDGFRTTMFLLNGATRNSRREYFTLDFTYAGIMKSSGKVLSCQMHLPMPPRQTTLADFFNPQVNHIEATIETGTAPYPIERTLLTTGMTLFAVESLHAGETEVATPELRVPYKVREHSMFWRS